MDEIDVIRQLGISADHVPARSVHRAREALRERTARRPRRRPFALSRLAPALASAAAVALALVVALGSTTGHEHGHARGEGAKAPAASPGVRLPSPHGHVRALHAVKVEIVKQDGRMQFVPVPGSEFEIPADLVLLAMGFVGPERVGLLESLGVKLSDRGNVARDQSWMTSVPGVFTAGDMQRGQSLIVWAIAEGRSAARAIDQYLMGESQLPAPLRTTAAKVRSDDIPAWW